MKDYPSIEPTVPAGETIYAFDKKDGSNVRAEWDPKKGFTKFGKRNGLLDDSNPILRRAEALMKAQEDALARIARQERWERAVFFFEFQGPSSFAGNHEPEEQQECLLFDVDVFKRGLLEPREFLKLFEGKVATPSMLYHGKPNVPFIESVQDGSLPGMTFEGIVGKGAKDRKTGRILMFKAKNRAWINRLRGTCADEVEFLRRV